MKLMVKNNQFYNKCKSVYICDFFTEPHSEIYLKLLVIIIINNDYLYLFY